MGYANPGEYEKVETVMLKC